MSTRNDGLFFDSTILSRRFFSELSCLLTQIKNDPQRAEEYYSRAVQADPEDGELLAEYAELVWELHHDGDKALSFFERAVQVAPNNRYILFAFSPQFGQPCTFTVSKEPGKRKKGQDDLMLDVMIHSIE